MTLAACSATARAQVQPTPPVRVEQLTSLAADDGERRRLVVRVQALAGKLHELGVGGHASGLARPGEPADPVQACYALASRIARAPCATPSPIAAFARYRGGTLSLPTAAATLATPNVVRNAAKHAASLPLSPTNAKRVSAAAGSCPS